MVSRLGFSTSCCQFSSVRRFTDFDVISEDDWMNFVVLGPSVVFLFVRRRESRNFCTSSASRPRFDDDGDIRFLPCPKMAPHQICGEANEESEDDEEDEVGFCFCPYYLLPLLPLLPFLIEALPLLLEHELNRSIF